MMWRRCAAILVIAIFVGTVWAQQLEDEPTTEAPKIPCQGKGKVCVAPKLCNRGFVDGNTLERSYNYVSQMSFKVVEFGEGTNFTKI